MLAWGVVAVHGWVAWQLRQCRAVGLADGAEECSSLEASPELRQLQARGRAFEALLDDVDTAGVLAAEAARRSAAASAAAAEVHPHAEVIERLSTQPPPLEPQPRLPPPPADSTCQWVGTVPQLAAAAMQLFECERVALDAEHHALHTYAGITCLLQLSTGTRDFLIDCLALRQDMALLDPVLSNPRICKVLHGGGNDVQWLQRDFGLHIVNCFDTEKACQVLGYEKRSLGHLLRRFCGVTADKSLGQQADWRQRPLSPELKEYATTDVHYLLYIADCLGQELLRGKPGEGLQIAAEPEAGEATEEEDREEEELPAGEQEEQLREQHGQQQQEPRAAGGEVPVVPPATTAAAANSAAAPVNTAFEANVSEAAPAEAEQQHVAALAAAMEASTAVYRSVQRSQAVTLALYMPVDPALAATAAAAGIMRRLVNSLEHLRLLQEQALQLEVTADCVHALCTWRDAAARRLDEGPQCVLPDAALLALAERAAEARAAGSEGGCNLQPRGARFGGAQLLGWLPKGPNAYRDSCRYPQALTAEAEQVAQLVWEAAAGHRPWAWPELAELVAQHSGVASLNNRALRKRQDPAAFRRQLAERFASKSTVYENCRMLSQEGELLCHTDRKKLLWYVAKGLAVTVEEEPLTVQLTFQHKTTDQQHGMSEFYTVAKQNVCVSCGEGGHYLRYRIVPSCYRRAMPVHLKSHRSHDVVLLCVSCHEMASTSAERLKRQLGEEFGVPLLQPLPKVANPAGNLAAAAAATAAAGASATAAAMNEAGGAAEESAASEAAAQVQGTAPVQAAAAASAKEQVLLHPYNVRKSALALQRYGPEMPPGRRGELEEHIKRFLGRDPAAAAEAPGLLAADLYAGLLAGLGPRTRRRTLRRWQQQGRVLTPELLSEMAGAAAEGEADEDGVAVDAEEADEHSWQRRQATGGQGGSAPGVGPSDLRNTGHEWHGQQLVATVLEQGGEEALLDLCKRFRLSFVDAVQPQFLPPGWHVEHAAKREFGERSIFTTQLPQQQPQQPHPTAVDGEAKQEEEEP